MRTLPIACALALLCSVAAAEPRAQFTLGRGTQANVEVPFELDLVVEGFEESPPPAQPALELPDATVTPLGANPRTMQGAQIINGRRNDFVRTTWTLRWQVVAHKAGRLRIPGTTVSQNGLKANAPGGMLNVDTVPETDDMKLELGLPPRAVFVGETIPVTLTWLFRQEPSDYTITLPILGSDAFTVTAPVPTSPKPLELHGGSKDLHVDYKIDQATVNGIRYHRVSTTLSVAPRLVGKTQLPPASVVAELAVGPRDFFGNADTRMFRASDSPRTLEAKPLPETNRPTTFAGAVGDQFSIEVRASRSVVQLGEPVELAVKIKSNQPLDNLALGKLDGEGRLPRDKFTVPADPPTGELSDEGKTKTFKIVAQVTGPATEIPAIAFSYFDTAKGAYQTIQSEPIALSVKGGSFVGASDVVAAKPSARAPAAAPVDDSVWVNADLSVSRSLGAPPVSGGTLWLLVSLLYAVPLGLLFVRSWQLRTRDQREEASEVRAARRRVEELLDKAGSAPARDIAGPLTQALRELARTTGHDLGDNSLLARIETESFAPSAAASPLSADLRSDAAGLLRSWRGDARRRSAPSATALVLLVITGAAGVARAGAFDDGYDAYKQAMDLTDNASARKAAFARASVSLGQAARELPDRPVLLTYWGNAALGAGDLGTATLAYRRALLVDGSNAQARHNLAWLRTRQPESLRPPPASAAETLLFFHAWPIGRKLIIGGVAFAIGVLLLVPWTGRRRRSLTGLAVIPLLVWAAMAGSAILADRHEADAIVMTDSPLRAADSAGAPTVSTQAGSLPRGTEVTVLEQRDAWSRIRIANGASGWVPQGAVERVAGH